MAYDITLVERIRACFARKRVKEKKLFGCACFMLGGNVLVCVWKKSLIARVGREEYEFALLEPHVREFKITGRPMKGWVQVEPAGIEHDEQMNDWIDRAIKFVSKLPAARSSRP